MDALKTIAEDSVKRSFLLSALVTTVKVDVNIREGDRERFRFLREP